MSAQCAERDSFVKRLIQQVISSSSSFSFHSILFLYSDNLLFMLPNGTEQEMKEKELSPLKRK
jgi:hypothetical protein